MSKPSAANPVLCPATQTLAKLLRDELDASEGNSVENHVSACPDCQRTLDQLLGELPDALTPTLSPHELPADEARPDWPGYTTLGRIDAGGMGVVWHVRDLQFGRDLAVKVMASQGSAVPRRIERFITEARVCAQLTHPFIVPVHTMGCLPDGRRYYTMKLVEGQTLAALLSGRPASAGRRMEFVQIFDKVCQAMAFAHDRGVIHRDLKPENIMVGAHGEVQLMDWGLAKVLANTDPGSCLELGSESTAGEPEGNRTRAGSVLGTAAYMAPEQAQGRLLEVDRQSDVFGLGGILCSILTGEPPYTGPSAEAVRRQAAEADLGPALARLHRCEADPELIALAQRCLAPRKADRLADAGAVAVQLAAYQTGVQERLRQAELQRAAAQATAAAERKTRRRTRALAAALVALLVLAAGGGLWAQHQAAQRRAEQARQESILRQEVAAALDQASRFRAAGHFNAGRQLLEQARQRLAGDGPEELRQQLEQGLAAIALARRLDEARQRTATRINGELDFTGAEQDYATALAEAGLGRQDEDPTEVAARVRASPVREEVAAALDDWAGITSDAARRAWLLAVVRAADPDPERDSLRQPELWQDREALMRLAQKSAAAPLSPQLASALARALMRCDGDAVPLLQAAQAQHPDDFWLNAGLGHALFSRRRPNEAVGYFQAALALRPRSHTTHNDLGLALYRTGQLEAAIRCFEEALRLHPNHVTSHYNLGLALGRRGQDADAIGHYEEAIRLNPKLAEAHCNLAWSLKRQGRFEEALSHMQKGHQLGSEQPGWSYPSASWVQRFQHLVRLHGKLPAILRGEERIADTAEGLDLAEVCQNKKLYRAAANLCAEAFAAQAARGDALRAGPRYNAACCASLAAAGQGREAAPLDAKERKQLRKQALDWLGAELALLARQGQSGPSAHRIRLQQTLRHWQNDPDLAVLRTEAALAKLAPEERATCAKFWRDVAGLLRQIEERAN